MDSQRKEVPSNKEVPTNKLLKAYLSSHCKQRTSNLKVFEELKRREEVQDAKLWVQSKRSMRTKSSFKSSNEAAFGGP